MGRGRQEWVQLVEEFGRSGLAQIQFAQTHGISHHALAYWVCKLRKEARSSQNARFLPVEVVASAAPLARGTASEFEATLPNGVRLRIQVGTDAQYLAQLFAIVR
jgi:transposase-like protein